jgi:hypothetical protein
MTGIAERKLPWIVEYALRRHSLAPLYVASADQEAPSGNRISTINHCATFEVITAVLMKIPGSWDVYAVPTSKR